MKQRPTIPPREIYIPVPKYPAEALKNKIEGSATVKILISRDGRPVKVVLVDVQGPDAFGEAAVEAAKKGVFVPAWRGNDPVDVWADKQFHFRMEAPTIAQ